MTLRDLRDVIGSGGNIRGIRRQPLSGRSGGYDEQHRCRASTRRFAYIPCDEPMVYKRGKWRCPVHGEMSA